MIIQKFLRYLNLKPRDPNSPRSIDLSMMHGINRISIYLFIFCLLVMLYRAIF